MLCCCIRDNIVGALMLWDDLVAFVGPADMMMFEGDVSRFCRDEASFGEVDPPVSVSSPKLPQKG